MLQKSKNGAASGHHSASQEHTKIRLCAAQGIYTARGLISLILACRPEYTPDMLLALSYD